MAGRTAGKTALVTGAGSGIGRACALALAREGATVVAADIDRASAEQTIKEVEAAGGSGSVVELDVSDEAGWRAAISGVEQAGGGLHILVNNAGLCMLASVLEMSLADWRRQTAVNLDGVFLGVREALPLMTRSGGGSIVNISSVAGLRGLPNLSGYCATKGGVRLFTKAVALECARSGSGVRVNSVHPGSIETPIWVKMRHGGDMPDMAPDEERAVMERTRAAGQAATPLHRSGKPEDIAEAVVYLCSDAAAFVTGTELIVDGGVMAG